MSTVNGRKNGAARNGARDDKVRVAIVGVGNCASSFVQGIQYYKDADPAEQVPGLMHVDLGGYHVRDIEFTAAFDIDADKVGKDLSEAIFSGQNNTMKFSDVPKLGVKVHRGMTHDGLGKYLKEKITKAPGKTADIVGILQDTQTDVVVCYLPVGSEQATKWYVEQALAAGVGFVNCLPVFIAREDYWNERFTEAGLPIIGDDIKSQVGATIVHRQLARLFADRGVRMERTSQLNVGGNMDFYNMLERERLESKKISKTNAVTSIMDHELPAEDVYIGPSDYVPWLTDRKWAHIRVEGKSFGDVPLNVELKLEVWDSPNSAGIVIDAVRIIKLALNHGIAGQLDGPSSYLMKSPHNQRPDPDGAGDDRGVHRLPRPPARPAGRRRRQGRRQEGEGQEEGQEEGQGQVGQALRLVSPLRPATPLRPASDPAAPARHILTGVSGSKKLAVAQVSPRRLGSRHEIEEYVSRTSAALAERGHRVLVAAPSDSRTAIRDGRRAIKAAAEDPRSLWREENPRLIAIGQNLPLPSGPRRRPPPIPLDVSRALEQLLEEVPFDVVHVHEPFAPSAGSAALRHSLSLNVATFHEPAERVLSTQVARTVVEMFFGRIDARTASNVATAEMLERFFPGPWEVIRAGADVSERILDPPPPGRIRIVHAAEEERGALRLLLRALRRLPEELDWEGVIWFDGPTDPLARVSRRLRERLRVVRPADGEPQGFVCGRGHRLPRLGRGADGARGGARGARGRSGAGGLRPRALPGARRRRRARPVVPGRRRADPRGPAGAPLR